MKGLAALVGRYAGPLYALAVVGTIAFVLWVGATSSPAP